MTKFSFAFQNEDSVGPPHWTWQARLLRNLSVKYISVDLGFYAPLTPGDTEDVRQATPG